MLRGFKILKKAYRCTVGNFVFSFFCLTGNPHFEEQKYKRFWIFVIFVHLLSPVQKRGRFFIFTFILS